MKTVLCTLAVIFSILFLLWSGIRVYNNIIFDINCGDRIKRAADANTIELAIQEMKAVISYAEKEDLTQGYTSVLYQTPDEDIGFWYKNLKNALEELEKVSPSATQLEKSNLLMKLRETLLDHTSGGDSVTLPSSISIFPHNKAFCWWAWISIILAAIFWIGFSVQVFNDY